MSALPHTATQSPIDFDLLLASTMFILTRAANSSEPHWPAAITQHLSLLIEHPQCRDGVLKKNLQNLHCQWQSKYITDNRASSQCLH